MSLVPRCVTCDAPIDPYGREGGTKCGGYSCLKEEPMPMDTETDGQWLRKAREKLGLTQRQLAERLQLTSSGADYVRHMEHGRRRVSGPIKVAINAMLGVNP